ncbi:unnamed protein product [Caenorhabditis angaria]|uniref:Protein phosphatase 1 regulatory subunit 37 homolog n=1 Tax=Caenorhabditis angaria TaxID=860376 RepID=A0A9P1ISB6_9PELO|nr:unnamed protein product [Caenorhabditis angaria]
MSMKFLTGLQDLLGLYEPGSATSSPASPIPPTTTGMYAAQSPPQTQQSHSSANSVRKKVSDANKDTTEERIRHCSHDRSVRFAEDTEVVTGFHEAPISIFHSGNIGDSIDPAEIVQAYRDACQRRQCPPSPTVEKQIGFFHRKTSERQEMLCLKGQRVTHEQMEALEEILKRVQFHTIDFEYTFLNDECAISLGEMIEFYDSCVRLNLSFNKQIEQRGWTAIFRAVKHSTSLQMLNLRYTTLTDKIVPLLCRSLRATPPISLSCLHLENTQMSGKNLLILICALKNNTSIKELYLGDNGLQGTDGSHLHQLIMSNTSIQLLDLRNNNLSDAGVRHISDALRNREALENSALSALVLWNNHVTGASMDCLSEALKENTKIETLNIGNNKLGVDGIFRLKPAIVSNSHLHRLGLQNTMLDCQGAIILAECIADNVALLRVDIRDNPIALAGLLALHSAMKLNKSITLLNIDANCVKLSSEKDEFEKYFKEMQLYCERNKEEVMAKMTVTLEEEEEEEEQEEGEKENIDMTEKKDEEIIVKEDSENKEKPQEISENIDCVKEEDNNNEKQILRAKREKRFVRSSSLTCTETVHDIHDRIREMSGSSLSLDATSLSSEPIDSQTNPESMKTIKKSSGSSSLPVWGSLPAIPQASPTSTPVTVKKFRRFSVSPSSSVFDVNTTSPSANLKSKSESIPEVCPTVSRPTSLSIGIPKAADLDLEGPASAPVSICQNNIDIWSPTKVQPSIPIVNSVKDRKPTPRIEKNIETDLEIEESCRFVINDLLNYVEYEENSKVERKASLLLRNDAFVRPDPNVLLGELERTPLTPSRVLVISEELESEEDDDQIVQQVVRGLVRDVLHAEKIELRQTLERRRLLQQSRNSPV